MILVIDNYDSFVYNLARYFERAGETCSVVRNDAITVEQAASMNPSAIVISPGPCSPKEAGISVELIRQLGPHIPIFGVCLGHQCIGEAYGADITRTKPMHGKASLVRHQGDELFNGVPEEFMAGRYHSLIVEMQTPALISTARMEDGTIMALRHATHPVYGVQFHPESVLTEHGMRIVENFMVIARRHNAAQKQAA